MKRLLVYLALLGVGVCQAEVPKLFTEKNFTSVTLAEAANHYIAIGREATIKELNELAEQDAGDQDSFLGNHISISERIGWVCRIVFLSDGMNPLRPPKYGFLSLPEKNMPASDWPLYPIAQAGSTYIVLSESYTTKSTPEKASHYIKYCADNGVFRNAPVYVPTKEQALSDTLALRASDRWKNIKWEDENGTSFPMGEQFAWAFFQNQARLISDAPKNVMIARQQPQPVPMTVATVANPAPAAAQIKSHSIASGSPTADKISRVSSSSGIAPMADAPGLSFR